VPQLGEIATEAGRRFGDLAAFVSADEWPLSYLELDRLSDQVAVGLARRGVGIGDVVVL
jgi:non-ribosomal peptide synthetase component E (peptide arylation enzyme)